MEESVQVIELRDPAVAAEALSTAAESAGAFVIVSDGESDVRHSSSEWRSLESAIRSSQVPVLFALTGETTAIPVEIVSACHLSFVAPEAIPALPEDVGYNIVAEPIDVRGTAEAAAAAISSLAPLAVRACIRAVEGGREKPLEDGFELELGEFCGLFETEDMREGTSAFLEKRQARFTGR